MVAREATVERPYRYDLSGLDNVFLAGITVYECPRCDIRVPVIPRIAQLHDVIAKGLLFKEGALSGREIRFLRKNAGMSAKEFARYIGIDSSHLSRIENGKLEHFSLATDKLARAVVAARSGTSGVRELLLELKKRAKGQQLELFEVQKDHWQKRQAA
jgi:transcriptional regulator with XRE-family HTH domain